MIGKAIVRGVGALLMLLGALLLVPGTRGNFARWQHLSGSYRAVNVVVVAGIAALVLGAALLLFRKNWKRRALLTGGAGTVLIGGTLMWGVLSGVIPCSGPS